MRAECICPIAAEIKLPIIGNRFSLPMQNNQIKLEFSFDHFQKNKYFILNQMMKFAKSWFFGEK